MFDKLDVSTLAQLGVGGSLAVILVYMILSMILNFLNEKKSINERILERVGDEAQQTSFAVQAIAKAVDNQTRLLEKMYDQQLLVYSEMKELKRYNSGVMGG